MEIDSVCPPPTPPPSTSPLIPVSCWPCKCILADRCEDLAHMEGGRRPELRNVFVFAHSNPGLILFIQSNLFKSICSASHIEVWSARTLLIYIYSTRQLCVVIFRIINPGKWAIRVEKQLSNNVLIMGILNNRQITSFYCNNEKQWLYGQTLKTEWTMGKLWNVSPQHVTKAPRGCSRSRLCPPRWRLKKQRKSFFHDTAVNSLLAVPQHIIYCLIVDRLHTDCDVLASPSPCRASCDNMCYYSIQFYSLLIKNHLMAH